MSQSVGAGYSAKAAWQKLGLTSLLRVRVRNAPSDYATLVGMDAAALRLADADEMADLVHIFATGTAELADEITHAAAALPAAGVIWVS